MTAQDRRMRQVLAELELISHGSTTSWNASGGDMKQRDFGRPPGEAFPPHEEYRVRYSRARSDDSRETVISDARGELARLTRQHSRPKVDRSDQTIRERVLGEGEGWPARTVAGTLRCLERTVREIRKAAGRDPDFGKALVCAGCGGPLERQRATRATCSDACRMRLSRQKRAA